MKKNEILELLAREDKWYLGGGNRLLWAPEFPAFLNEPGFWDKAVYYNYAFQPLFTWTLLNDQGQDFVPTFQKRTWTPAELRQEFQCKRGNDTLSVVESKCMLPFDVAGTKLTIKNPSKKKINIHLVVWTAQENYPSREDNTVRTVNFENGMLTFEKEMTAPKRPKLKCWSGLGVSRKVKSHSVQLSEGGAIRPLWRTSPFWEIFENGKLNNKIQTTGINDEGIVFMALDVPLTIAPKGEETVQMGLSAAPTVEEAKQNLHPVTTNLDLIELSKTSWNEYFSEVPEFHCSSEFINRYYWYRWYGLRLCTLFTGDGNYKYPSVAEGIGYFRAPITYSAQCHMLENRWMIDPELAQGSLLIFIANQREDGGFRGYIDVNHYRQEMFYHGNWGNSVKQLNFIHPDKKFLDLAYEGLKKYVGYFDRERDEEGSGLYDIDNHYETGQEYMHRYMAVSPQADMDNWGEVFRLKGVDVTVYLYELKLGMAYIAKQLGYEAEAEAWKIGAEKIKISVLTYMWDPNEQMFFDVNPTTLEHTYVKATTCFYPYFTDIVDEHHLEGLKKHLLNKKEFWSPWPAPSSSLDDQYFSVTPDWKGKRMNCPWNGRVWPMTNSHIAEALAICAIRFNDKELRKKTSEFIDKFIRMMFFDGDPKLPNCFEHYSPMTAKPSVFRGIDDYQHSWVVDLIIKYAAGIRVEEHSVVVDPFAFGMKKLEIRDVAVRGHKISVLLKESHFAVFVDNEKISRSTIGKPLTLEI
jgi:hypothetical protein